jgi:hypothetical protein
MMANGIKPAYIFDGKPPEMKKGVVSHCLFVAATISLGADPATCFSSRNVLRSARRLKQREKKLKKQELRRIWTVSRAER